MSVRLNEPNASARLQQAVTVGMVQVYYAHGIKTASIIAPPDAETMSDDDWLLCIAAGSEMARELRGLGYEVRP